MMSGMNDGENREVALKKFEDFLVTHHSLPRRLDATEIQICEDAAKIGDVRSMNVLVGHYLFVGNERRALYWSSKIDNILGPVEKRGWF